MTHGNEDLTLPDLRFVSVDALVPHEQHDAHRLEPLVRQLQQDSVLRNPPVVAPLPVAGRERFVVLDGANRSSAAAAAGFPHMVVQVVRYEEPYVRLATWYHALSEFPVDALERALCGISGLHCSAHGRQHGRALLARREALACIVTGDASVLTLAGGSTLADKNTLLNSMVDLYRARRFYRVPTDSLEAAIARYPDVTALVVFPHFEPDEILELATDGERLPAGITRHLVRGRALRVDVPIERMSDRSTPLHEKNRWLLGWLREKVATRHVRFYEESTVLFDE